MFVYDALRVSWVCVSRRGARAAVRRDFSRVALSGGRVPLDNAYFKRVTRICQRDTRINTT